MDDEKITEYYHRGVVCHMIGHDLAIPLDVEMQHPGEGEVPAAKRLLERVFANYGRYFDAVVGDSLYLEAPFINFCREHRKHVVVVAKGDHRLLLQDADGLFSQRAPGEWSEGRRTVQYWDEEGFTSCEGVSEPLRVLRTREIVRLRERIAGEWKESTVTSSWYWATTFKQSQLSTREFYRAGHGRWDIENDCFNSASAHWGLDHVYKHEPTAIVNFILTLFLAFVLVQCFWQRNLKAPLARPLQLGGAGRGNPPGLGGFARCACPRPLTSRRQVSGKFSCNGSGTAVASMIGFCRVMRARRSSPLPGTFLPLGKCRASHDYRPSAGIAMFRRFFCPIPSPPILFCGTAASSQRPLLVPIPGDTIEEVCRTPSQGKSIYGA